MTKAESRYRTLVDKINSADKAYFVYDAPILWDEDYDQLSCELHSIESESGKVDLDSPSLRVGFPTDSRLPKVVRKDQ